MLLSKSKLALFLLTFISTSMAAEDPLLSFLQRVQSSAFRTLGPKDFDPKLYVDLPLKYDLPSTISAFDSLPTEIQPATFQQFLNEYFYPAGSDLLPAGSELTDFDPNPEGFLAKVENEEVRGWALEVHGLWKVLARRVSDEVKNGSDKHTLLYLPNVVMIPGSRFREVYYWDSYWIIRGLLVSKMYDTAKGIVLNLISLTETYGCVINGARTYYTNRSQPPLLSSMVMEIYEKTRDLDLIQKALPSLLKEHKFWVSDVHQVIIEDKKGRKHNLSRYQARWYQPRPENAIIDEESAVNLSSSYEKEAFYHELASAAESGWDFSSRWMRNSSDLTTLRTTSIIPVDLNTFICKLEYDISVFAKIIGDNLTSEKFLEASKNRQIAIRTLLWNSMLEQWVDYFLHKTDSCEEIYQWNIDSQSENIFASNFAPLWFAAHCSDSSLLMENLSEEILLKSLKKSGLIHEFGISTSLLYTTQQWDLPNGWAPLQDMIVHGLIHFSNEEAINLGENIAIKWIKTNYEAYKKTKSMHEKYDVDSCGGFGGGGEYKPQTGFGWSNGVILAFLEEFGWPAEREIEC
ncbi:hypothetical protein LUZ60_014695 [Juncus effusus]|nr:hypothetical protein LUZ60_014695 [Juncus effusus]